MPNTLRALSLPHRQGRAQSVDLASFFGTRSCLSALCLRSCAPGRSPSLPTAGHANLFGDYEMARELKLETLDPLSAPERLMLFCVASRMDPAMAGLPHRTAELLVMKNLARRDQARLSLTDQGRAALYALLGGGGRENRDGGDASPRVRTPMPPSVSLVSLIRRRLIALTVRGRRPFPLGGRDCVVAAVSLRAKRRHPLGRSKH